MLTLQALYYAKLSCSLKFYNAQKTRLALTLINNYRTPNIRNLRYHGEMFDRLIKYLRLMTFSIASTLSLEEFDACAQF